MKGADASEMTICLEVATSGQRPRLEPKRSHRPQRAEALVDRVVVAVAYADYHVQFHIQEHGDPLMPARRN
jgi:hypothetical protein